MKMEEILKDFHSITSSGKSPQNYKSAILAYLQHLQKMSCYIRLMSVVIYLSTEVSNILGDHISSVETRTTANVTTTFRLLRENIHGPPNTFFLENALKQNY